MGIQGVAAVGTGGAAGAGRRAAAATAGAARRGRGAAGDNRGEGAGMDIQGVAAVVTGGASGLGEATARELARRGAKVALFDRDADTGGRVARQSGGASCEVDVRR